MLASPMTSEDEVAQFADRQASELQDALGLLGTWPSADLNRAGAVGYSFGARAALLLAMRDPRVKAVVSLDGGIGTAAGAGSLRQAPSFHPDRATAPILHFYEDLDPSMTPDFTLLQSLPAAVRTERVVDLHHVHFTTLGLAATINPDIAAATHAGPTEPAEVMRVFRGTLAFLQEHVGKP